MKIYTSQLGQLLKLIEKGNIIAILLYGPDKGYISNICSLIIKKFNYNISNIDGKFLSAGALEMALNSQNFFSEREFIKITHVPASIDNSIKEVLQKECLHFPAFIADELSPSSSLRKFFETEKNLAAIGCYHDDEQNIARIIISQFEEEKKTIDIEALNFLKNNLKGDREVITSELNKLFEYTKELKEITLKEVQEIISSSLSASGDEMCIYFAKKDLESFLSEVEKLKEQNINEILIIRALIRYFINLYIVLSHRENGATLDEALKSLSPPIFFKYLPDFRINVQQLTLKETLHILDVLQKAELTFKTTPNTFDFYFNLFAPAWIC